MKKWLFILLMLVAVQCWSQPSMRTVVTPGPVATGESFQVQYVLEDMDNSDDFYQPDFKGFHIVSGPQYYTAQTYGPHGVTRMRNIVYTLAALKPGLYIIPGASALVNGKLVKSRKTSIKVVESQKQDVIGMQDRMLGDYYLRAGEDPYQKIRKNLFIRVQVDRRSCYVGEPIIAVFKLYSTLESRSDIIKNPGLYGFTVQDMIGLHDGRVSTEVINGKKFDVHTIRKVQMYALRPGTFQVDPMEVRNKVEFYKAIVPGEKETEQTIREGVIDTDDFRSLINTVVYESNMSTEPVTITVRPTPEKARPDSFSGAVGKFSIQASLLKNSVHTNEDAILEVRISGAGNFTQLSAPEIKWPAGITAFDPEISDRIDPATAPLKGERLFRYHFVSNKTGTHLLPAVVMSFFNPDSNRYNTLSTSGLPVVVTDSVRRGGPLNQLAGSQTVSTGWWIVGAVALLMIIALLLLVIYVRRTRRRTGAIRVSPPEMPVRPDIDVLLANAKRLVGINDKSFYVSLREGIWRFCSRYFGLSGSQMNRLYLVKVMQAASIPESAQQEINRILDHCETGMFTNVFSEGNNDELYARTLAVLKQIESLSTPNTYNPRPSPNGNI
ncbi:MAG: BatD family protein [Chitinophagaceae bacterium]